MADAQHRRFTDEQVALVLRTAIELQEGGGGGGGAGGRGLPLAQLEQIAAEAGIDAAVLHRAVARVDEAHQSTKYNRFVGAATELVVERTVPGEIGPEDFDRFLAIVRRVSGQLGEPSTMGRLFGWKGTLEGVKCEVAVSSDAGYTTVRVHLDPEEAHVGLFMVKVLLGGLGGGFIGGAMAASVLSGPAGLLGIGAFGLGYAFWRRGNVRLDQRLRARAADIADALAAACAETKAGAGAIAPRPPHQTLAASVSPSDPRP